MMGVEGGEIRVGNRLLLFRDDLKLESLRQQEQKKVAKGSATPLYVLKRYEPPHQLVIPTAAVLA